jgi:NADH:ubiquinone oxidoreductase subunit 5 (subunit L)/multisubunit Na+/H+ antiporter MnhA subunit
MYVPLIILAVFAVVVAWNLPLTGIGLEPLLEQSRPAGTAEKASVPAVTIPSEHDTHAEYNYFSIHVPATLSAFGLALFGFVLATAFYGLRKLDPEDARRQFAPIHRFLLNKWWFDELYHFLFVRPVLRISGWVAAIDKKGIDWLADNSARATQATSRFDDWIDRLFVDGTVNGIARWTHAVGLWLRTVQTGNLRQYVVWIAVGTVALFVVISFYFSHAVAGS